MPEAKANEVDGAERSEPDKEEEPQVVVAPHLARVKMVVAPHLARVRIGVRMRGPNRIAEEDAEVVKLQHAAVGLAVM